MKKCIKCFNEKPLEQFPVRKDSKDGYRNHCKVCEKNRTKKYRKDNSEYLKTRRKDYYEENKDIILKKCKRYREKNKEKYREYNLNYKKENKDMLKLKNKRYKEENKEQETMRHKLWAENNREKSNNIKYKYMIKNKSLYYFLNAKRRAIKLKATPKWSELDKIKLVYEKTKWLESLTGLKYEVDHVIPLQGKNVCGLHVWQNLQILEVSENRKKSNKLRI